jgi:hypothetical protein
MTAVRTTAKRRRSDSAAAAIVAAQSAALGPLDPPKHVKLRRGDKPFWNSIMLARARDTWTAIDLTTAATLARCQADIEKLQSDLDATGYLIEGKANPLCAVIETLTRRAVALSRALHVHAEATVGRSADAAKALANERAAETEDDDLIPTLRVVGR